MVPLSRLSITPLVRLFRPRRLSTADDLAAFLRGEAMQIAQTSLLGYLRGHMGTGWPRHFSDPVFAAEIETATRRGFLICLSDLTIFSAASLGGQGADAARLLYAQAVGQAVGQAAGQDEDREAGMAFAERLADTDWQAAPAEALNPSLGSLIDVAPVSQAFRTSDRAAFANALELRWSDIRKRFDRQADLVALRQALGVGGG